MRPCFDSGSPSSGTPDFTAWLRLRTDLYLDTGLITLDDLDGPSALYTDTYDDYSTHLLASDDDGVDVGMLPDDRAAG